MSDKAHGQESLTGEGRACLFCEILKAKGPSHVVFEDSKTLAFLDIKPLFPGHLLLIPKEHYGAIADAPEDVISSLFNNARLLSAALERGLGADGTFIAVNNKVSQSVPHLHVHIVPRKFGDGLKGFFWPRYSYKEGEMSQTQEVIIKALAAATGNLGPEEG